MNPLDPQDPTHDDGPGVPDETALDETALDRALAEQDEDLAAGLRALLDPDASLHDRTVVDVDRALRSTNTMDAVLDLAGVGWWTVRALLTDDRTRADRKDRGH